jgi:hypothetical protein
MASKAPQGPVYTYADAYSRVHAACIFICEHALVYAAQGVAHGADVEVQGIVHMSSVRLRAADT